MMAVQGPLAAMSPRASSDAPATVAGLEDSFASLVGGGQLSEMPKETSAVKEIEARVVEMVDDTGAGAYAPEDIDEMASLPVAPALVTPIPAPIIFPGMVPLEAAAAPLSDASLPLRADEPQAVAAALPALEPEVAKDGFVLDDPLLARIRGDRMGGPGAIEHAEAVTERGWTAVAATKFHGRVESAGTAAPGPGVAAFRPAMDGPSFSLADDGAAQPMAPKAQSAEPMLPRAESPATVTGAPPTPADRHGSEIEGKKRLSVGGLAIEWVFARGSVGPAGDVKSPAAPQAQIEGDSVVPAPETVLRDTALNKAIPKPEPVSAAPGPDRAALDAKLAAPSTGPVETRADLSFSTTLTHAAHASAAEAPQPPRSPLVQAALDRILPLPAVAGETVVRLNPHGLGIIEVVLQNGRNGALDVALRVQNPLVLEAMRQERDAVAQTFLAAHGAAAGSLSMDMFHSGTGQRGTAPGLPAGRTPAGQAGQEDAPEDAQPDWSVPQISRADRVNIVT